MNGIPRTVYVIHYTENDKESVKTFASKNDALTAFEECKSMPHIYKNISLEEVTTKVVKDANDETLVGRIFYTPTTYNVFVCVNDDDALEYMKTFLRSDWSSIRFSRFIRTNKKPAK